MHNRSVRQRCSNIGLLLIIIPCLIAGANNHQALVTVTFTAAVVLSVLTAIASVGDLPAFLPTCLPACLPASRALLCLGH